MSEENSREDLSPMAGPAPDLPPSPPPAPGPDVPPMPRPTPGPDLPPAAQRALAEAAERRRLAEAEAQALPVELGGRDGPEPVRYGDWEKKGLAIDF